MSKLKEWFQKLTWLNFMAALFLVWTISNLPQVDSGRFNYYNLNILLSKKYSLIFSFSLCVICIILNKL